MAVIQLSRLLLLRRLFGRRLARLDRFIHLLLTCRDEVGDVEAERLAIRDLLARRTDRGLGTLRDLTS
jgi:hypothetical protein